MAESVDDVCRRIARTKPSSLRACNRYVQAVLADLYGRDTVEAVQGTANDIVGRFKTAPFNFLGCQPKQAVTEAGNGKVVVGGLAHPGRSGHVFIVQAASLSRPGLPTPWDAKNGKPVLSRGGQPKIFNGSSLPAIATPDTSVDIVFSREDEARVSYAWLVDPR